MFSASPEFRRWETYFVLDASILSSTGSTVATLKQSKALAIVLNSLLENDTELMDASDRHKHSKVQKVIAI